MKPTFVPHPDDFWLTYKAPKVEVRINQRFLEQANSRIRNKLLRALSPNLAPKRRQT